MKNQSGMLLLEVLLALAIFATAVTGLVSSMQWQLSALDTLKQEMFARWVADNQLIKAHCGQDALKTGQSSQLNMTFAWQFSGRSQTPGLFTRSSITVVTPGGRSLILNDWASVSGEQGEKHD